MLGYRNVAAWITFLLLMNTVATAGIVVSGPNGGGSIKVEAYSKKYRAVTFDGADISIFGAMIAFPRSGVLVDTIHEFSVDENGENREGPVNQVLIRWETYQPAAECRVAFTKSKNREWEKSAAASAKYVKYTAAYEWSHAALKGSYISSIYPFVASRSIADWLVLTGAITNKVTRQGDTTISYFSYRQRGHKESYHYYVALSKNIRAEGNCIMQGPYDEETAMRLLAGIEWNTGEPE